MRLALRQGAYHAAVTDGAYILTHQGPVRLSGTSITRWLDRLAPYLDGRYTLAELTATLSPDRAAMVTRIVTTLRDRGVVRELGDDEPAAPPPARGGYAYELGFVDYFRDSAAAALARYRASAALVVGSGPLLAALVRAGLRSGLAMVRVAVTQPAEPGEFERLVGAAKAWRRDPGQQVEWQQVETDSDEALAGMLPGMDVVVHAFGPDGARRAALLERCCATVGLPVAQAEVAGDEVWLVGVHASWVAARRRRGTAPSAAGGAAEAARNGPDTRGRLGRATASTVATQLVHGVFRALTGIEPPTDRAHLTRVSLESLTSEIHAFVPHPLAQPAAVATEGEFRTTIAELERGEPLAEETFSRRAARAMDDRLGVFTLTERDWAQVPLSISEAVVSDPVGLLGRLVPRISIVGAGFGHARARCQAALWGLAQYGALMVDPRRLVGLHAAAGFDLASDPSVAAAALRRVAVQGLVWAQDLADPATVRLVPARAAFPALRSGSLGIAVTVGVGAGYRWHDAVLAGLLGHCRRLTLAELSTAGRLYPQVDLAGAALDEAGARCRDLLTDLGELPQVYQVTGSLQVPTFAFCLPGGTVAYACAMTASAALGDGLLQVLRAVQARAYDQPGYAPATVVDLPARLRGPAIEQPSAAPEADATTLAARLRGQGRTAVAVPLDHDPAVAEIMPYLVNVVLCRD